MRIFNTLVTSDQNVASERTNGSLSVPRTLVADTFTGSVQTHKQNKYTLSRPRMHADTPSLTPRGARTCTIQLVQYGTDGSETTGTHFIEGDCVARRWPALGDQPGRAVPSKARGAPASRHASTSKHGPAARKNDSKSSFPANALLTSPSRRVVAIEATRSGSISHRGPVMSGECPVTVRLTVRWWCPILSDNCPITVR